MIVTNIIDNSDGSATLMLDLSKEEHDLIFRHGFIEMLKEGLRRSVEDYGSNEIAPESVYSDVVAVENDPT
jgi:hypothetical protein